MVAVVAADESRHQLIPTVNGSVYLVRILGLYYKDRTTKSSKEANITRLELSLCDDVG